MQYILEDVFTGVKMMDMKNSIDIIQSYSKFPYMYNEYTVSLFLIVYKSSISVDDDYDIDEENTFMFIKLNEDEYSEINFTPGSNTCKPEYYEIVGDKIYSALTNEEFKSVSLNDDKYVFVEDNRKNTGTKRYEVYYIEREMTKDEFIDNVNKKIKFLCRLKRLCRLDRIEIIINQHMIASECDLDNIDNLDKYIREPFEDYLKYD